MKGTYQMKRAISCLTLLLMLTLMVSAGSPTVEGSWRADVPRGNGRFVAAVFDFGVEGSTLNGLVRAVDKEFPLMNGKINGNEIAFSVEGATGFFTGKLNGDQL